MKRSRVALLAAALPFIAALTACADTITQVINLETDTFVSSDPEYRTQDEADNGTRRAELTYLEIGNSATLENRALIKLPTGNRDENENVEDALGELFLAIFFMPLFILQEILDCYNDILQPENLTNATLILDVEDNTAGVTLTDLELRLMSGPWWHTADWTTAHPFSSRGAWTAPGGDLFDTADFSESPTASATTVQFAITNYFRDLMSQDTTHYGFAITAPNATPGTLRLRSTQTLTTSERPRVEATYSGTCNTASGRVVPGGQTKSVFILGKKPVVIREPIAPLAY